MNNPRTAANLVPLSPIVSVLMVNRTVAKIGTPMVKMDASRSPKFSVQTFQPWEMQKPMSPVVVTISLLTFGPTSFCGLSVGA